MTQGERVRFIRKDKNMTLEKFGEKIGLKKNSLSQIENGKNDLTEQNKKAICREFHVNYAWLSEGIGDVYNNIGETLINRLADEYQLSQLQIRIIEATLQLTDEQINDFTFKFFGFKALDEEKDHHDDDL
ncbi:MAG: helix-turn-helix domain-containing protein [Massilimicrobiota timonensis]